MARKPQAEYQGNLSPRDRLMALGSNAFELSDLDVPALEREGISGFEINIPKGEEAKAEWEKVLNGKEMRELFGTLAMQVYLDRDNPPVYDPKDKASVKLAKEYLGGGDISLADKVKVLVKEGKVAAFLGLEESELTTGEKVGYVSINATAQEHRRQGVATALMKEVFDKGGYDVVTGVSSMPQDVAIGMKTATESGFTPYYMGYKNGVISDRGTAEEQEQIARIHKSIIDPFIADEVTPEGEMPPGVVIVRQDIGPVAPLQEREIDLASGSALDKTMREGLMPIQNGTKDTVYGLFVAMKNK